MKSRLIGMATFATALSLAAPALALAWEPSRDVQRILVSGRPWAEVLPDTNGAVLIHAAIDIPAPARAVWALMTDCRMAARLVVTVTSCKILSGDQQRGWDVREQVTRGNIFLPEIHNVMRNDFQPFSVIRFRKVGGNLKAEAGEWRLEPLSGGAGTRVIYVNRVAVNILAPAALVRAGLKRDTPKVLVNLRRESVAASHR
ncbi:MAG TPA: SRPBCC family protein [Caulobacteraceae bacterium]